MAEIVTAAGAIASKGASRALIVGLSSAKVKFDDRATLQALSGLMGTGVGTDVFGDLNDGQIQWHRKFSALDRM